jgi:hypothetical protein
MASASSLAGQRVAGATAPRQKIPLVHRHSPPVRRPEFPSQDANRLAMKRTTPPRPHCPPAIRRPCSRACPSCSKSPAWAARRSNAGSPAGRSNRRCAWASVRSPGAGRTWTAGQVCATPRSTNSKACIARRAPGQGRARPGASAPLTRCVVRPRLRARCWLLLSGQPPSPSGGEDIPVDLTYRSISGSGRVCSWTWIARFMPGNSRCMLAGKVRTNASAAGIRLMNPLTARASYRSPGAGDSPSARAIRDQASTGIFAGPGRFGGAGPCNGCRSRPWSRAQVCHSSRGGCSSPRVICRVASARTPQPRSFSAKVSRQRCRSALRGFNRLPWSDSARTLRCTCGLA